MPTFNVTINTKNHWNSENRIRVCESLVMLLLEWQWISYLFKYIIFLDNKENTFWARIFCVLFILQLQTNGSMIMSVWWNTDKRHFDKRHQRNQEIGNRAIQIFVSITSNYSTPQRIHINNNLKSLMKLFERNVPPSQALVLIFSAHWLWWHGNGENEVKPILAFQMHFSEN